MKYLIILCVACLCFVSCKKKGPYGYNAGEIYMSTDNKRLKVIDAGEDFIIIVHWDEEKDYWGNEEFRYTREMLRVVTENRRWWPEE